MAFLSGLRRLFDPNRLAMTQVFVAGDHGTAATLADRFRQLEADRERLRTWPARGGGAQLPSSRDDAVGRPGILDLAMQQSFDRSQERWLAEQMARENGGDPENILRRMRNLPSRPPTDQSAGRTGGFIGRTAEMAAVPASQRDAAERRIIHEKFRRDGGVNGYGYVPSEQDVNDLARALFTEFGRVDNWGDMHAGGAAIINRVRPNVQRSSARPELGATLQEVLERTLSNGVQQFPFMPRGGIRSPGGHPQWRRSANPRAMRGDERKAYEIAHQIAEGLLSGQLGDPTGGAISYRHSRLGTDAQLGGSWTRLIRSPFRSPNNQHIFYRHPDDPLTPQLQKPDFPLITD